MRLACLCEDRAHAGCGDRLLDTGGLNITSSSLDGTVPVVWCLPGEHRLLLFSQVFLLYKVVSAEAQLLGLLNTSLT